VLQGQGGGCLHRLQQWGMQHVGWLQQHRSRFGLPCCRDGTALAPGRIARCTTTSKSEAIAAYRIEVKRKTRVRLALFELEWGLHRPLVYGGHWMK
jgi:hypothetical protein